MSSSTTVIDQLTDLFNASLTALGIEASYTSEELEFGTPELYDAGTIDLNTPTARNTRISVSVAQIEGEPLVYTLHYNRLNLATLFAMKAATAEAAEVTETTTHDILTLLSSHYQVEFTAADVEDELADETPADTFVFPVKATEASLSFFGEASFSLVQTAGD